MEVVVNIINDIIVVGCGECLVDVYVDYDSIVLEFLKCFF